MATLIARHIRERNNATDRPMITPFYERTEVFWCPIGRDWIKHKYRRAHIANLIENNTPSKVQHIKMGDGWLHAALDKIQEGVCWIMRKRIAWHYRREDLPKRFSYGLSGHGYDIRLAENLWIFPLYGRLGSAIERFDIPTDLKMKVLDKSSLARRFFDVKNTVAEAGWQGYLTLEISCDRPWPMFLRAGTPIAQAEFGQLSGHTTGYSGKYQNQQAGPQKAR